MEDFNAEFELDYPLFCCIYSISRRMKRNYALTARTMHNKSHDKKQVFS